MKKIRKKQPDKVDVIVGGNIKNARIHRGYSQEYVAEKIGVSFQQLQKYETGQNRIGSSRMVKICEVLNISIVQAFENTMKSTQTIKEVYSNVSLQIARSYDRINDEALKTALLDTALTFEKADRAKKLPS